MYAFKQVLDKVEQELSPSHYRNREEASQVQRSSQVTILYRLLCLMYACMYARGVSASRHQNREASDVQRSSQVIVSNTCLHVSISENLSSSSSKSRGTPCPMPLKVIMSHVCVYAWARTSALHHPIPNTAPYIHTYTYAQTHIYMCVCVYIPDIY